MVFLRYFLPAGDQYNGSFSKLFHDQLLYAGGGDQKLYFHLKDASPGFYYFNKVVAIFFIFYGLYLIMKETPLSVLHSKENRRTESGIIWK